MMSACPTPPEIFSARDASGSAWRARYFALTLDVTSSNSLGGLEYQSVHRFIGPSVHLSASGLVRGRSPDKPMTRSPDSSVHRRPQRQLRDDSGLDVEKL